MFVPFTLTRIDGKKISSADLKGKYLVINFWDTWCGPCKSEMPELQKFFEKYKDSPDVVLLTIDTDDTLEQVKKFIADTKYTIPVLREGDHLSKAGVNAFPTTWFVDPHGKIVFEKIGASKHLLEEFSWRVEGMMETEAAAKSEPAKTK